MFGSGGLVAKIVRAEVEALEAWTQAATQSFSASETTGSATSLSDVKDLMTLATGCDAAKAHGLDLCLTGDVKAKLYGLHTDVLDAISRFWLRFHRPDAAASIDPTVAPPVAAGHMDPSTLDYIASVLLAVDDPTAADDSKAVDCQKSAQGRSFVQAEAFNNILVHGLGDEKTRGFKASEAFVFLRVSPLSVDDHTGVMHHCSLWADVPMGHFRVVRNYGQTVLVRVSSSNGYEAADPAAAPAIDVRAVQTKIMSMACEAERSEHAGGGCAILGPGARDNRWEDVRLALCGSFHDMSHEFKYVTEQVLNP